MSHITLIQPIRGSRAVSVTKRVCDVQNEKVSLEVYECQCGFHLGIDATYLDQVESKLEVICPSCGDLIETEGEAE